MAPAVSSRKVTIMGRRIERHTSGMDVNRPFFHPCFGHISPLLAQLPLTTAPQMPNCRLSACLVPGLIPGLCALVLASLVSGCSTTEIDRIPQELGGLPANAPARPAEPPSYPAVHDMPPPRAAALLDAEQQKKLEADLVAIRNRQPNQQKNIAKEKAKAEKAAKAKAGETEQAARARKSGTRPRPGDGRRPGAQRPGAAGTPPWPVPAQATGASPRP